MMSKVIKVSDEVYEKLYVLSEEVNIPISEVANMLIEKHTSKMHIKEKNCVKKYIEFED